MNLLNEKVELANQMIKGKRRILFALLICILITLTFACTSTFVFGNNTTINDSFETTREFDFEDESSYPSALIIPSTYFAPRSNISFSIISGDTSTSQRVNVSLVSTNIGILSGTFWVNGSSGKGLSFNGVDGQDGKAHQDDHG